MGLKEVLLLRIAKRWISGVDLDSAIKDAKKANSRGMGAVINFLGEDIKDPTTADSHKQEYLRLQDAIAENGVKGAPSVKLTQLGLGDDEKMASERLGTIAENAEKLGQWLWIDMEASRFTDSTISIYEGLRRRHDKVGVALQAYLRRSEADLESLLELKARVRLVKGAYREAHDKVFTSRSEVRANYSKLMRMLFEGGDGFAIGTHDSRLVEEARKLAEPKEVAFEFEMLKGIRDELKLELVRSGYKVSEYLPYGDRWYDYSKRRMTEHPSNVILLLRSLL